MSYKSLIAYASDTGNTEKLAFRFKETFEKNGWECDIYKITKDTDFGNLPFKYADYDLVCFGSPTIYKSVLDEIKTLMNPPHVHPPLPPDLPPGPIPVKSVRFTHEAKKGIVFTTFSGNYLGPKEAEPALGYMEATMEMQLKIQCAAKFACPGYFERHSGWYKDNQRPNERDLMKAEIFLEETIEDLFVNGQNCTWF